MVPQYLRPRVVPGRPGHLPWTEACVPTQVSGIKGMGSGSCGTCPGSCLLSLLGGRWVH
jgi:hypothetical protein